MIPTDPSPAASSRVAASADPRDCCSAACEAIQSSAVPPMCGKLAHRLILAPGDGAAPSGLRGAQSKDEKPGIAASRAVTPEGLDLGAEFGERKALPLSKGKGTNTEKGNADGLDSDRGMGLRCNAKPDRTPELGDVGWDIVCKFGASAEFGAELRINAEPDITAAF
jgi:hypothetical protein